MTYSGRVLVNCRHHSEPVLAVDQIDHTIAAGQACSDAIIDATAKRARPLMLTAPAEIAVTDRNRTKTVNGGVNHRFQRSGDLT